ncbi:neuromedin-K receptor-like [Rhopilema esculentum]|uniref:neuromedin-K receptor-like n=1 Tax=Rhopilema esculentum TaxID=499914 RepID=UPI0031D0738B
MVSIDRLNWITSVPVGIPVCLLGILGNLVSIGVWMRFVRKRIGSSPSSAIYFIALGIADTGLLVFFLLTDGFPKAFGSSMAKSYAFVWFHAYVGFPLFFFFIVASIWLLVGVTINRLIMVRFPLLGRRHCTVNRTCIAIGCILAFCFIINFPHFFNYEPIHSKHSSKARMIPTAYSQQGSAKNYEFWVHCMFLVLAPWFSIAVLNAWLVITLLYKTKEFQELEQNQDKITERQKQDRQITKVLLTVTFAFLILLAWQCVNQCFFMLQFGKEEGSHQWTFVQETYAFAKLGVVLNSSINCMLYCFSGSTFRKELRRLVTRAEDTISRRTSTPMKT